MPDPSTALFLDLLARDIDTRPAAMVSIDQDMIARIRALTAGVDVDLDEPIGPEDDKVV